MTTKLIIFGTSSLARMAYYYATRDSGMEVVGFSVDREFKTLDHFMSLPVLAYEDLDKNTGISGVKFFVAVGYGYMKTRGAIYKRIASHGYRFVNIVSSDARVSEDAITGDNNFFFPGAVIEPFVTLGSNNVFWSNSTVCHETTIGDHNFFASNVTVGGRVEIGCSSFFGFSSVVSNDLKVGSNSVLGAGSVLLTDAEDSAKYIGAPAKRLAPIDSC